MVSVLRSTSVRLALGYAALFAISSFLLVGFIWWSTAGYLDRQTDAAITLDCELIREQLKDFGLPGALAAVRERVAAATDGRAIYLLADDKMKPLAGNLANWPQDIPGKQEWSWIYLPRDGAYDAVRLRHVALVDGLHLLVGRDVENRAEIHTLIIDALGWTAGCALVLGIGGGILLRRAVLRRVEMINGAATAIVRGDLSRRVPTRGTADAFDQLARTINVMLYQIEQLIEGMRNTSNTVAHDLRTPLAELRARLEELIRARPSMDVTFEEVNKAVADIDRVIAVFNALLRLAEIDSGVRRSGFRQVELVSLVTEVAELYGPLIDEKQGFLELDAAQKVIVNGDPYLLTQAVGNLVDNAAKYTPPHGTLSLRIAPVGDGQVEIAVADNGPGITDPDKLRVTQRFYRCGADGATAGIGLGLSVVDAVARLHDGTLTFSDNHPGLIAVLKLPAVMVEPESPPPASESSVFSSA
jgi:signal transduction histidine kinase